MKRGGKFPLFLLISQSKLAFMILKTRDRLIEVARLIFYRKGVEKTTMNDIALASQMSRRTIYTYFRTKKEIYKAVIESECEEFVTQLRNVVENPLLDPTEKMRQFIIISIDNLETNMSADPKSGEFDSDMSRIERIRRTTIQIKEEMLRSIVIEGVRQGVFDPRLSRHVLTVMIIIIRGLESETFRGNKSNLSVSKNILKEHLSQFVVNFITNNPNSNETT